MKYGGKFLFESSMNWVRIIKETKDLETDSIITVRFEMVHELCPYVIFYTT